VQATHTALEPLQVCGAQAGFPAVATGSTVHVPLALAPAAVEQASQLPEQALLQHTPSEQEPLPLPLQARQLADKQSCPAARLHAAPPPLRATQSPLALQ
jgi:hypothetical protein